MNTCQRWLLVVTASCHIYHLCLRTVSHTEGDMPSIAVTPLPHLQMMRNFRDGEVLTGVAQSTGNLLTSTCTALLDFLCFT